MPGELRIAVTGSAGVGKTTLTLALGRELGLPVIEEEMRAWLENARSPLGTLPARQAAQIVGDLFGQRLAREGSLRGFVADNCAADFAAYALQHGCADACPGLLADAQAHAAAYDAIFLLPWGAIPYERDGVRSASQGAELRYQLMLEALLERNARSRLHRVPQEIRGVEARVRFCLDRLGAARPRERRGFVSLVGAGPGDPKLLTLRAAELLETAEVVAYDQLVAKAVLERISPRAERIRVGHRAADGPRGDERLHPAVLERARKGMHVVRLKQGDPFLFGRGGDEAQELVEAGIPFEVVPGVTAALGATAYAGIPLTHRDFASDVVFATGHDLQGGRPSRSDWSRLAAGSGTLVLFMAARKLGANLSRLVACGRPADTPAALISAGTMPEQQVVVGTLANLAERAAAFDLAGPPALVVVGEVVRLREQLAWFERARERA